MLRKDICSLDSALAYQNDEIIYRFIGMFNMPFEDAEVLFHETKKWVWLAALAKKENVVKLFIDESILFIDEMWHNFILFTKEYHAYCFDKFGFYVHHYPTLQKEKIRLTAEIESDPTASNLANIRRRQYSYIYDKLGAETLELWYGVLSDKYPHDHFLSIRKK